MDVQLGALGRFRYRKIVIEFFVVIADDAAGAVERGENLDGRTDGTDIELGEGLRDRVGFLLESGIGKFIGCIAGKRVICWGT